MNQSYKSDRLTYRERELQHILPCLQISRYMSLIIKLIYVRYIYYVIMARSVFTAIE